MGQRSPYAGFWARCLAMLLDVVVLYGALKIIERIISGWMPQFISICLYLILITLYFVALTCKYGQTLGKMVVGIRVMRDFGQDQESLEDRNQERAITWDEALLRELIGRTLSGLCLFIGFIMISFQPKRQALHDLLTHFIVIWDRDTISKGGVE